MLALIVRGADEETASQKVAKELGQNHWAVKQDWRRRDKWLPDFMSNATKTALEEIVISMKELLRQAWLTYKQSPSGSAVKVGALRELRSTIHDMAEIFQSSGLVLKLPERVEMSHVSETRLILERYQSIDAVIRRIEGRNLSENDSEQPLHSTQADAQTE